MCCWSVEAAKVEDKIELTILSILDHQEMLTSGGKQGEMAYDLA